MVNQAEREFIKQNLFEQIPMQFINLYNDIRTMKRAREEYSRILAEELGEI